MIEGVLLALAHLAEERQSVEPPDAPLESLQGHLVGSLRAQGLHGGVLDCRDQVPRAPSLVDLVQRVDHRRREVLQGDDQILRRNLARVEDERLRLRVLRVEGEDLDFPREEELQAFRVVRRAEDAVLGVHVEDQYGCGRLPDDPKAHELVEDRLARARPAEDPERLLDELAHVHLHVERLDARDRAQGRGGLGDLVDALDVLPGRVATRREVRRDRLRLAQLLRVSLDELDHPELCLGIEDRAAVAFVGLRSRHHDIADGGAGELVRDIVRLVDHVLDEAIEIVARALDDDGIRNPQLLGIVKLEFRDEAVDDRGRNDFPDLHRRSLASLSKYSWNALRLRPSTPVSPCRIVRTSRPIRRADLITASS